MSNPSHAAVEIDESICSLCLCVHLLVFRICGTLHLRLNCFKSFQQSIALRVLWPTLLLVFLSEYFASSLSLVTACDDLTFVVFSYHQDNSLQALWSNGSKETKLIRSVPIYRHPNRRLWYQMVEILAWSFPFKFHLGPVYVFVSLTLQA